jgi:hypothetical protein
MKIVRSSVVRAVLAFTVVLFAAPLQEPTAEGQTGLGVSTPVTVDGRDTGSGGTNPNPFREFPPPIRPTGIQGRQSRMICQSVMLSITGAVLPHLKTVKPTTATTRITARLRASTSCPTSPLVARETVSSRFVCDFLDGSKSHSDAAQITRRVRP